MPENRQALPESIAALAGHGVERNFKKKSIILHESDAGDTIFILLEGSVRVFGQGAGGKEVTYGQIDAPSYFGEMSLDSGPRSASIEAVTNCRCVMVTNETVRAQLFKQPELALELISKIIMRARLATQTVRSMALKTAYSRLRETLYVAADLPESAGLTTEIEYPVWLRTQPTHAQLAQRIGTSREMVSKILRDLEKGQYILTAGRKIAIAKKLPTNW